MYFCKAHSFDHVKINTDFISLVTRCLYYRTEFRSFSVDTKTVTRQLTTVANLIKQPYTRTCTRREPILVRFWSELTIPR